MSRRNGIDPVLRSRARQRALQAIYAWQLAPGPIDSVLEQFEVQRDAKAADQGYFEALVRGVARDFETLDALIAPELDRELDRVDPIERAILRIATWELKHRPDVPWRVILNEAIESAKRFGAEYGHTYVNGVLDGVARRVRVAEIADSTPRLPTAS